MASRPEVTLQKVELAERLTGSRPLYAASSQRYSELLASQEEFGGEGLCYDSIIWRYTIKQPWHVSSGAKQRSTSRRPS